MFVIISIIITVAAIAAGGIGGGGGSSSAPSLSSNSNQQIDPSWNVSAAQANVYRTSEYNAQWGLEAIHAAEAYAALAKNGKNIAGEGVKIAITDTGVQATHSDIANNFDAANSRNYLSDNNIYTDSEGHGTHVASLAAGVKNNSGIQGVAYDAQIVSSKVLNNKLVAINRGISDSALLDGVGVINASWQYQSYTTYNGTNSGANSHDDFIMAQLNIVKQNDVLLVAATGNDGDNFNNGFTYSDNDQRIRQIAYSANPKPAKPALFANNNSFSGYVLAVGAVDQNNFIADFSNICGIARNYCLVAPGVDIYGATSNTNIYSVGGNADNKYVTLDGTSMAAPQVSGAVTVIRSAWPFLTAPQVANILLDSATDLGAIGVDTTYGHGMLNLYAAVQAQGSNNFSYGTSASQTSYDVRQSSISSDPIFGDAFIGGVAQALKGAIFLDDYGRDYKANLDQKISTRSRSFAAANFNARTDFAANYKTDILPLSFGFGARAATNLKFQVKSYSDFGKKFANFDKSVEDKNLQNNGFSFAQNILQTKFGFAFNMDETRNLSSINNNLDFISISGIATNPYQSFAGGASQTYGTSRNFNQIFIQQKLFADKLKLNFSHQSSYENSQLQFSQNNLQNKITDFGFDYALNKSTNLVFSLGNLQEFNNNFLNSKNVGAFESGSNARTSYFKIAMSKKLTPDISLIANFSQGHTKLGGNNLGVFRNFENIQSRSMMMGLVAENFFQGRLGLSYSEPLRVYSGKAVVDIAVARDNDGNITRYNSAVSLKPQGKERDYEIFYSKKLSEATQINLNFMVIKDAGNVKSSKANQFGMLSFGLKF